MIEFVETAAWICGGLALLGVNVAALSFAFWGWKISSTIDAWVDFVCAFTALMMMDAFIFGTASVIF